MLEKLKDILFALIVVIVVVALIAALIHLVTSFIFLHTGWYPFGDAVLQTLGGYRF